MRSELNSEEMDNQETSLLDTFTQVSASNNKVSCDKETRMELSATPTGILFSVLFDAVNKAMADSTTPQLLRDLASKRESLKPLIYEIESNNRKLEREDKDLEELKQQLEEVELLISKRSKLKGGPWNNPKKRKYKDKLVTLDESLTTWLDRLRVQANNLRMELLMLQQIEEHRKANESYETLMRTRYSADATEVMVETQPDIQIQPFSRQIQNWVVNQSYGSWAILFILFLVILVMACAGSAGTKWFVLNIGVNYLGINNY